MKRRHVLRATGSALAGLALAGCLSPGPGEGPGDNSPTDQPSPSPTAERSVTDSGLSDVSSACGTGDNQASVSYADGTATVTGTIGGSDTCDTAKLQSVDFEDGTLRIVLKAEHPEMTGTPACGQCLTDIEYEATVTHDGPAPATVVVEHVSMGETVEVARTSP